MNKLLEAVYQQASQSNWATSAVDFDENLLQQFVIKNLVWDFHCISMDDYLRRSKGDKEQLLLKHYNQMKMGEQITLILLLSSSKVFYNMSFLFFKLFCSKFPKESE